MVRPFSTHPVIVTCHLKDSLLQILKFKSLLCFCTTNVALLIVIFHSSTVIITIIYLRPTYYGFQQPKIPGNIIFNILEYLSSLTICNIKFHHSTKKPQNIYIVISLEKVHITNGKFGEGPLSSLVENHSLKPTTVGYLAKSNFQY